MDHRDVVRVQVESVAAVSVAIEGINVFVQQWVDHQQQQQQEEQARSRPGIPTTLDDLHRGAFEVNRMLNYDEQYCRSTTRLRQDVLKELIARLERYGIEDSRISAAEKVIIFLDYCAHKKTYRELRRIYQHSFLSFTRHINAVALALVQLFKELTKDFPNLESAPFQNSERYHYFRGCLGALDGSHIPVRIRGDKRGSVNIAAFRNRKGFVSQNVMFACDFDLNITFVQPGFEGSAHDGTVLKRALESGFKAPSTHYYLGDGGYSKKHRIVLVPYQRTRYHLREQADAQRQAPETKEELFNLRHARLRNCIERLIGVMKKRWRILRDGPEAGFTMKQQCRFVWALSTVHNFTNASGQTVDEDEAILGVDEEVEGETRDGGDEPIRATTGVDGDALENSRMGAFREGIADAMWADYQAQR